MKLANPGTVPVYTVSGSASSRALPEWLVRRRKRSLKKDPEFANRVELLQDFEFEESSVCVQVSDDGDFLMSTGTYKPQIHVHSLPQLSLSFARHTNALNRKFVLLSTDYSKSLHLQEDRSIEFHTPGGCHYSARLPRYGRDLVYDRRSTEALIPSAGSDADGNGEVFRMSLEQGRFLNSYKVELPPDDGEERGLQGSINAPCVTTAAIAEASHGLLAFGTSVGTIEFIDPRIRTRIAALQGLDGEVSALNFSQSGLTLANGTARGIVSIYDLRRPVPLQKIDHGYGYAVKNLIWMTTLDQERKIMSADKKSIKIWDEASGDLWTSIQPEADLNDVTYVKDTGMLFSAVEGRQQGAYFIPRLGKAPKWCRFLDNLVEEMAEETVGETYDNYKFLTVPELKSLSLAHLIGKSNLLRPYMHGYFVASKLYEQARLIANPYVWEEERSKKVKEKIEKERASRIRGQKKVKVNQKLVDKLLKKQERRDTVDVNAGLLGDDRFKALFEDEEFAVDEHSREFRMLNPSTKVDGEHEGDKAQTAARNADGDSSDSDDLDDQRPIRKDDDVEMRVSSSTQSSRRKGKDTALGSRSQKENRVNKRPGGARGEKSVTFVPEQKKRADKKSPPPVTKKEGRRSASTNTFRRM